MYIVCSGEGVCEDEFDWNVTRGEAVIDNVHIELTQQKPTQNGSLPSLNKHMNNHVESPTETRSLGDPHRSPR